MLLVAFGMSLHLRQVWTLSIHRIPIALSSGRQHSMLSHKHILVQIHFGLCPLFHCLTYTIVSPCANIHSEPRLSHRHLILEGVSYPLARPMSRTTIIFYWFYFSRKHIFWTQCVRYHIARSVVRLVAVSAIYDLIPCTVTRIYFGLCPLLLITCLWARFVVCFLWNP